MISADLILAIINYILISCSYEAISPHMWNYEYPMDDRTRVNLCLHAKKVLKPQERLENFMKRPDVRTAFENAIRFRGLSSQERKDIADDIGIVLTD